jgi:hypothetical protein
MMRLRPVLALGAAALVVAAGATGITYAATSPQTVYACINSHGVLRLLANGHCAGGYSKVGINRHAVRGARGPVGPAGVAGPGTRYVAVTHTTADFVSRSVFVDTLNLNVRAECNVGGLPTISRIYFEKDGTSDYTVTGSAVVVGSANITYAGTSHFPGAGLIPIEFTEQGSAQSSVQFYISGGGGDSGQMSADLTVERAGKTALVHFYIDQNPEKCRAQAWVTPST